MAIKFFGVYFEKRESWLLPFLDEKNLELVPRQARKRQALTKFTEFHLTDIEGARIEREIANRTINKLMAQC